MRKIRTTSEATKATQNLSNDMHHPEGISLMRMRSGLGRPRLSPSDVKTVQGLRHVIKRDMEDVSVCKDRIHTAMTAAGEMLKSVVGLNEEHHGDNPKAFQLNMVSRILGCLTMVYSDLDEITQARKPKDRDCLVLARKAREAKRRHSQAMKASWAKRKAKAKTQTEGGAL